MKIPNTKCKTDRFGVELPLRISYNHSIQSLFNSQASESLPTKSSSLIKQQSPPQRRIRGQRNERPAKTVNVYPRFGQGASLNRLAEVRCSRMGRRRTEIEINESRRAKRIGRILRVEDMDLPITIVSKPRSPLRDVQSLSVSIKPYTRLHV